MNAHISNASDESVAFATTPIVSGFIAHFGEMGSRWGINRTVGQIYALLFVSPRPLCADEIVSALCFSRSNVSMGLKELLSWQLVKLKYLSGDRREFFETPTQPWEIFMRLAKERKKREVDPTLTMLRNALLETPSCEEDKIAQERMRGMHELIETLSNWFEDIQEMDTKSLDRLLRMGKKVQKILEFTQKIKP